VIGIIYFLLFLNKIIHIILISFLYPRQRRKKRLHFFLFSFRRRISFKQKPAASITAGSGKLMIKSKKA